jgi:hypothetical protein
VARTGRLRDTIFGTRVGARLGTMALGSVAVLGIAHVLASAARDARLVDPSARVWGVLGLAVSAVAVLHVTAACLRGGRARDFLLPLPSADDLARTRDDFFVLARRATLLLLSGAHALLAGAAWIVVPAALLVLAPRAPGGLAPLSELAGAALLVPALAFAPLAQTHAAASGRLRDAFDLRALTGIIARAPLAWLAASLVTFTLAAPLFLFEIEPIPADAAWLPSLAFIAAALPSRALFGLTIARARRRAAPAPLALRVVACALVVLHTLAYVLIVAVSPYASWRGYAGIFDQHVLFVPTSHYPWSGLTRIHLGDWLASISY